MSKGLEALESLRQECNATYFDEKGKQWWTTDKKSDYRCNIIETALKALEIIKKKNFDLYYLQDSKDLEMYNDTCDHYRNLCYLTQEEYDLLKEVLL